MSVIEPVAGIEAGTTLPPEPAQPPPMDAQALTAYLLVRGYSQDLAPKLAENMIANPTYEGNKQMIQAASKAHVQAWADQKLAAQGVKSQDSGGAGAQAVASHFQRLGYSPQEAITLAYHAVGVPKAGTPVEYQIGPHKTLAPDTITSEPPTMPAPTLSDAEVARLQAFSNQLPASAELARKTLNSSQGSAKKVGKAVADEYKDD